MSFAAQRSVRSTSSGLFRFFRATGFAVLGAIATIDAAPAVVTGGQCVQPRGGNSCTAGDVTFILVGLGVQDDGCVGPSDTVTLFLGAQLQNTSANTRYDIGMYIYDFLGTETQPAVSQGYAYNGTSCAREALRSPGTASDQSCTFDAPAGSLNLLGGDGPFFNDDADSCADLLKVQTSSTCDVNANGQWDDSFMVFDTPITLRCNDGTNGPVDGFVDIPTCATWGQNSSDVGGATCDGESEVLPGTPSKCNCANVNSTVPKPNLALSCSCSPTTVRTGAVNGASTACTVSFANNVSCTPNMSTAERFRCGASSYLQFDTVAATPNGSYIFGQTLGNAPTETTGGNLNLTTAGTVRWTPRDTVATGGGTELGVIGQGETGSMSFQYFVDPAVPNGTVINFATTAYWANASSQNAAGAFSSRVAQPLTATCSITASNQATWARVSSLAARRQRGVVTVEFETAAEVGSRSFVVERLDPATGAFVRIAGAVPALDQLPGGRYRLLDASAPAAASQLTYRLIELDGRQGQEILGPFVVAVEAERRERPAPHAFTATARPTGARVQAGQVAAAERLASRGVGESRAAVRGEASGSLRARLNVSGTGMVRAGSADVAAALGLNPSQAAAQIRAGRLQLTRDGVAVAWEPAADGDGLVFHAPGFESPHSSTDVFWLEAGTGSPIQLVAGMTASSSAATSFTAQRHFETDAIAGVSAPLPVEDFWIWRNFFPGYPGFDRATFPIDVPGLEAAAGRLTIHVVGFAIRQRAEVRLNGAFLSEIEWAGVAPTAISVEIAPSVLREGANQVEIIALEAERGFWLDSFDLSFARRFVANGDRLEFPAVAGQRLALSGFDSSAIALYDVSRPLAPRRVSGASIARRSDGRWGLDVTAPATGEYLASSSLALARVAVQSRAESDLRQPADGGAEYLIVAPHDLIAEAQRLADHRQRQGLAARVVDLDVIMDVFNHGRRDPAGIRELLRHALLNWPVRPRYLVLAGKGTYDERDILGLGSDRVPTTLVSTPAGLAPADSPLADLDGDGIAEVAVGRIPAITAAEFAAYVDKVEAFESAPSDDWQSSALMIADDADTAGNFAQTSEALSQRLGALAVDRLYLGANGSGDLAGQRARLRSELASGHGLVNYVGHGGLDRLTSEGLLVSSDVATLGNGARLPVMTTLTCLAAQFAYPSVSSLGEELVLQADGGAIALFGPTWLSHNGAAEVLGAEVLAELAESEDPRLGDRLLRGLRAFASTGGDRELARHYVLLGDPALLVRSGPR